MKFLKNDEQIYNLITIGNIRKGHNRVTFYPLESSPFSVNDFKNYVWNQLHIFLFFNDVRALDLNALQDELTKFEGYDFRAFIPEEKS